MVKFLTYLIASGTFLSEIAFGLSANNADAMATLKLHNDLRSKVAKGQEKAGKNQGKAGGQPPATNMQEMIWDAKLANTAQKWAENLAKTGQFKHNPNAGAGENIAMGSGTMTCERSTQMWYDEVVKGNCKTCGSYNYRPLNWNGGDYYFGHYTQVVWDNTNKLGCGWAKGSGGQYCVCNYSPGGNYGNQFPYDAGTTASKCPAGTSKKSNGLCGKGGSNPTPTPKPTTKPKPPTTRPTPKTPSPPSPSNKKICITRASNVDPAEGTYTKKRKAWVKGKFKLKLCSKKKKYCLFNGKTKLDECKKTASIDKCVLTKVSPRRVITLGACKTSAQTININDNNSENILFEWKLEYKDIIMSLPFIVIGWCCCIIGYILLKMFKGNNKKKGYVNVNLSSTDNDSTATV